jgi:hypothetical protein
MNSASHLYCLIPNHYVFTRLWNVLSTVVDTYSQFQMQLFYDLNAIQIFMDPKYVQESIGYRLKAGGCFSTDHLAMIGLYICVSAPAIV